MGDGFGPAPVSQCSMLTSDRLRVAVVVATKGRPATAKWLLRMLERQEVKPDLVVFSATEEADVERCDHVGFSVEYIFGPAGLTKQRNRGLDAIEGRADVVVFFDDDFLPAKDWIRACEAVFRADPRVCGLDGRVIYDGAAPDNFRASRGLATEEVVNVILEAERNEAYNGIGMVERENLYGCNMAFRLSLVGERRFDENLVGYGLFEDRDFSTRIALRGRLVRVESLIGAHVAQRTARAAGTAHE